MRDIICSSTDRANSSENDVDLKRPLSNAESFRGLGAVSFSAFEQQTPFWIDLSEKMNEDGWQLRKIKFADGEGWMGLVSSSS